MYNTIPDGLYREPGLATLNYDKLTHSIAAGRQAMHDCMGVMYQNKKPEEASAPLKLVATDNKDAFTGAFHSQQQLVERLSCFRQYGAIFNSSLQIALKKRRYHFFIQTSPISRYLLFAIIT